jgi:ADP-ribosylglycohydrolase
MIGAIIGDIFGSIYEFDNFKPGNRNDIDFFDETQKSIHYTDDTVMTIAIADAILNDKDINQTLKEWFSYYPEESYGGGFRDWCKARDDRSNDSCGNGSAMRVSSIG